MTHQSFAPARVAAAPSPVGESRRVSAGLLLLFASCLPLLGATLLTPNLANIAQAFAGTPHVTLLVSLVVTAPGAMIGLLSPFAGAISDRFGRKRLLVGAAALYSVLGIAPLFLQSLGGIVVSRLGVGVCEAVIMTVATALIVDYFDGARRAKYLSLQTVFTTVSAVVFVIVGGAAATNSWRGPFWIYLAGILLALPLALVVWEPRRARGADETTPETRQDKPSSPKVSVAWRVLAVPLAFTLFAGLLINIIGINLSFLLPARGFTGGPAQIGLVSALLAVALAVGALVFRAVRRFRPGRLLPVVFAVEALGLGLVSLGSGVGSVVVGGLFVGVAAGVALPTLITWALGELPDGQARGRVAGLWTSAFWFGQLFYSFLFTGLSQVTGSRFAAIGIFGLAAAVASVAAVVLISRRPPVPATLAADALH